MFKRNDVGELVYMRALDVIQGDAPRNNSVSGYGSKLPTGYTCRLSFESNRRYRVYAACYSNNASPYVVVKGERILVNID